MPSVVARGIRKGLRRVERGTIREGREVLFDSTKKMWPFPETRSREW